MEFEKVVKERRSVRKFKEDAVDHAALTAAVSLAAYAPSWKNTQIARYIIVEDKALKEQVANECVMGFEHNANVIKNAPALVVLTYIAGRSGYERDGSFSTSKKDGWEMFDAGIAAQTFCLAAQEQGIGTVIMGIIDEEKVIQTLEIPEGQKVAALIAAGIPAEEPTMPKRKTAQELMLFR